MKTQFALSMIAVYTNAVNLNSQYGAAPVGYYGYGYANHGPVAYAQTEAQTEAPVVAHSHYGSPYSYGYAQTEAEAETAAETEHYGYAGYHPYAYAQAETESEAAQPVAHGGYYGYPYHQGNYGYAQTESEFATGMNGAEDLGGDIIKKGDSFHYAQTERVALPDGRAQTVSYAAQTEAPAEGLAQTEGYGGYYGHPYAYAQTEAPVDHYAQIEANAAAETEEGYGYYGYPYAHGGSGYGHLGYAQTERAFATAKNGDEDLGQDIIMKGAPSAMAQTENGYHAYGYQGYHGYAQTEDGAHAH